VRATSAAELLGEDAEGPVPGRRGSTVGWLYLTGLALIALSMVGYTALAGDRRTATATRTLREPSSLTLRVSGPVLTLEGRIPDQEARDQLMEMARARYGPTNVIDTLVIDEGMVLEGGSVTVAGSAVEGDEAPGGLQSDLVASFGLRVGPAFLTRVAPPVTEADAGDEPVSES
jgi:hypothetical protein